MLLEKSFKTKILILFLISALMLRKNKYSIKTKTKKV